MMSALWSGMQFLSHPDNTTYVKLDTWGAATLLTSTNKMKEEEVHSSWNALKILLSDNRIKIYFLIQPSLEAAKQNPISLNLSTQLLKIVRSIKYKTGHTWAFMKRVKKLIQQEIFLKWHIGGEANIWLGYLNTSKLM